MPIELAHLRSLLDPDYKLTLGDCLKLLAVLSELLDEVERTREERKEWRAEVEKLRAALSRVRTLLSEWSNLGKAHEYGCGNGRPCDACEVDELLAAFAQSRE